MLEIKVKYMDDACRFEKLSIGDWIDLRSRKDMYVREGEVVLIPLGVAMELPYGYEAHVLPRSSTPIKFGITMANSEGIIDNSYRGEWQFVALAHRDATIKKGDRICQFRIEKSMPSVVVTEVDELSDTERGDGGFGSTGVR